MLRCRCHISAGVKLLYKPTHLVTRSLDLFFDLSIRHASFVTYPKHELRDVLHPDARDRLVFAGHCIWRAAAFCGHRHAMHAGRIDHVHERLGLGQADRLGEIQLDTRAVQQRINRLILAQHARQERRLLPFSIRHFNQLVPQGRCVVVVPRDQLEVQGALKVFHELAGRRLGANCHHLVVGCGNLKLARCFGHVCVGRLVAGYFDSGAGNEAIRVLLDLGQFDLGDLLGLFPPGHVALVLGFVELAVLAQVAFCLWIGHPLAGGHAPGVKLLAIRVAGQQHFVLDRSFFADLGRPVALGPGFFLDEPYHGLDSVRGDVLELVDTRCLEIFCRPLEYVLTKPELGARGLVVDQHLTADCAFCNRRYPREVADKIVGQAAQSPCRPDIDGRIERAAHDVLVIVLRLRRVSVFLVAPSLGQDLDDLVRGHAEHLAVFANRKSALVLAGGLEVGNGSLDARRQLLVNLLLADADEERLLLGHLLVRELCGSFFLQRPQPCLG